SEGFGPNYSLRNNAYCESCSSCGLIFFQYKMNIAYHDAKYADLYEETMYNALLGSLDLEGKNFYYTNPLTSSTDRHPWHGCPCCVGNIPRTLLMVPTWTYMKGEDALYVNMFIGSTINVENVSGTDVEMVQVTDYPWSGNISITVNPAETKDFTLYIRVPDRKTSVLYEPTPAVSGLKSLTVNGEAVTPVIVDGYAEIKRTWNAGDKVEVVLPMEIQTITADERIVDTRGRIALRYGPIIFNVEAVDNGNDIIDRQIGTAPFTTEWRDDLLHGVLTIKGQWADGEPLLAIPNYARNNRNEPREPGDRSPKSIVWLKK
ncbi:MAG: glycoside hydrolase family 127 protein, partial [Bacteroidales bacterium]|nr:glycoside hydrolase family 127 protein [Bacteroidales bacterium]